MENKKCPKRWLDNIREFPNTSGIRKWMDKECESNYLNQKK